MASSETERADEEASSKPAATEEVDGGWASVAPKPRDDAPEKPAEPKPTTEASAPEAEARATVDAPAADAPPVVESAPEVETPKALAEPEPVVEAPAKAAPAPPPPLPKAKASPPDETAPSPAAPPPLPKVTTTALLEPAAAAAKSPPPEKSPPPSPEPVDALDAPAPLFGEPPTKGWFFVGGGGMLLALFVGILVGRGLAGSPERAPVSTARPPERAAPPPVVALPPTPPPAESASAPTTPTPKTNAPVTKHAAPPFNAQAAKLAIDRVVPKLKGCKQPGEPPGQATVTVTFAPTGRVSNAAVTTTRYAGTRTGSCISQRLREAKVPEFTGAPVTVKRGVAVR